MKQLYATILPISHVANCCCICLLVLFSGCEKNWRGLVVEKRVYRDGYYVHVPWERRAPVNEYPKPQPYPVDCSRTVKTDTMKSSNSTTNTGSGNSTSGNTVSNTPNASALPPNGNGNPGPSPVPTPTGTDVDATPPAITYQSSPPLQYQPDAGTPPLQRTSTPPVAPPDSILPPDSAVVMNDSVAPPTDSAVADRREFNFPSGDFSLVGELGFYNPVYVSGTEIKLLSYNAGVAGRYTIRAGSRHKISLEAGAFLSHFFIAQDQYKAEPMFVEHHDHERMLQFKTRFMLMDHIYINRNPDAKVDAVEFGAFADVGVFSSHVAIDNSGNTADALLTRNKTRLFGLHYLRKAQFGLTARIANDVWSVFANYRFSSLLKAVPDGGDLPKLVIGATFSFGE